MKLAIIGSRNFSDKSAATDAFRMIHAATPVSLIISGGARGADRIGAQIAADFGIELKEYIPDWDKHGKSAGFIRNADIIGNCEAVLCFWDGVSKGTAHSLSLAKKQKKKTIIIYF